MLAGNVTIIPASARADLARRLQWILAPTHLRKESRALMSTTGLDVVDISNQRGRLLKALDPREPGTAVALDEGGEVTVPTDRLIPRPGGGLRLTIRFADVGAEPGESTGVVIPVVEEQLEVGKREVETGRLRVQKRVSEHEQTIDEPLFADEITIERVAINRVIDEPTQARVEGETTVIPLFEERIVLQKHLVLREEVRVTKRRIEHRAPQIATVRREEVTVERVAGDEKKH
jgi:uncharacterized protein (TIGR02271 family)